RKACGGVSVTIVKALTAEAQRTQRKAMQTGFKIVPAWHKVTTGFAGFRGVESAPSAKSVVSSSLSSSAPLRLNSTHFPGLEQRHRDREDRQQLQGGVGGDGADVAGGEGVAQADRVAGPEELQVGEDRVEQ